MSAAAWRRRRAGKRQRFVWGAYSSVDAERAERREARRLARLALADRARRRREWVAWVLKQEWSPPEPGDRRRGAKDAARRAIE